jgi:hypothetical protein
MLYNDSPINNKEQDKLGRAVFAAELAKTLTDSQLSDGFAVGIYGTWGSGKTSVLNMMEESVDDLDNKPDFIRFNPWLCSDTKQMVEQFFATLAERVTDKGLNGKLKKYAKLLITSISSAVSSFDYSIVVAAPCGLLAIVSASIAVQNDTTLWARILLIVSVLGAIAAPAFRGLAAKLRKEDTLDKLKKDISNGLKKYKHKIIIIIDDIDRLYSKEIIEVFQLVRSLADFPNVVYLLSFDRDIVVKSLEKAQCGNGSEYLEKIIHYPIELPIYSRDRIGEILIGKINEILGASAHISSEDEYRFREMYTDGISNIIVTLRDVNRFCNTLSLKSAMIKNEINIVDIVGVTCLQVFAPDIYTALPMFMDDLCGSALSTRNIVRNMLSNETQKKERIKEVNTALMHNITDNNQQYYKCVLDTLFPLLAEKRTFGGYTDSGKTLADKRICNSNCFNRYFALSLEPDAIPNAILNELFAAANETRVAEILTNLGKERKLESMFKNLAQHFKEPRNLSNAAEHAEILFIQICNVWGQISQFYTNGGFGGFDGLSILYNTKPLLHCLPKRKRLELIINAISVLPVSGAEELLTIFEWENGRLSSDNNIEYNRLFDELELQTLEKAYYDKIENAIGSDSLWGSTYLGRTIYVLEQLNNTDLSVKISEYIKINIANDDVKLLDWVCKICVSKGTASNFSSTWDTWNVGNLTDDDVLIPISEAYNRIIAFSKTAEFAKIGLDTIRCAVAFMLGYENKTINDEKNENENDDGDDQSAIKFINGKLSFRKEDLLKRIAEFK